MISFFLSSFLTQSQNPWPPFFPPFFRGYRDLDICVRLGPPLTPHPPATKRQKLSECVERGLGDRNPLSRANFLKEKIKVESVVHTIRAADLYIIFEKF